MARKEDIVVRRRKKVDGAARSRARDAHSEEYEAPSERRSRHRRKKYRRQFWLRLIAVVVIAALALTVWLNWDVMNPEYVWTWVKLQATGGDTGDGYPLSIEGNTVVDMDTVGHQLCVLTDSYLLMYNSTAGETVRRPCAYATPALDTAGKYALIAEVGGKRVRLETLSGTRQEIQAPSTIVSATVADNGNFAVVVDSSSYQSEIWVYSAEGKQKYHWSSASMLVMDVALQGNTMAVIGTNASGGALRSEMLVMDITTEAAPARYSLEDTLFYHVGIFPDKRIAAVGDTGTLFLDPSTGVSRSVRYDDRQLLGYAFSGNRLGLQLGSYGSTADGELFSYASNGDSVFTAAFTGSARWLEADGSGGYLLLSSSGLSHIAADGAATAKGTYSDGMRVVAFDKQAIVLGLTKMDSVKF